MTHFNNAPSSNCLEANLVSEAQALPFDRRKKMIEQLGEIELQKHLKELFSAMDSNLEVSITHGPDEYGKDLVLVRHDPISTQARAVVVKCGSITGKANGPIDTIKSQVGMALDHPYSPDGIKQISISEIIIVASGNISTNAKERLEREFQKFPILFYDLATLVKLFTAHYPRVFFGGYEYDYLSREIVRLDNAHMFANRNLTLSQAFIEPTLQKVSLTTGKAQALTAKKSIVKMADLPRLIKRKRRLTLIGEAGCGKSALLKKLTIDEMRRCRDSLFSSSSEKAPIYCEAKSLVDCGDSSNLLDTMKSLASFPESLSIGTIYVDGMDEARASDRTDLISLLNILSEIEDIPIVISSRCGDYFESAEWDTYEISAMKTQQALSLCEKVLDDQAIINSLKTGIHQIQNSFDLTPLAVFLLVDIIEEHQEIPASIAELYEQYADSVLGKFDKDKGIEVLFEYELKKRFLGELAYEMFVKKEVDSISMSDFWGFGQNYFTDYDWPLDNWEAMIEELNRSCLIVTSTIDQMLQFKHRSFLEFFASYHLHTNPDEDIDTIGRAIELYFDSFWTDVAFYYFGLRKSMTLSVLDNIFSYEKDDPFSLICKMRVGRLMQACWHSKIDVKIDGLARSCKYAIPIRESFLSYIEEENPDTPPIISDIILISISLESFNSVFLSAQIVQILLDSKLDSETVIPLLCLFAGASTLIDLDTKMTLTEKFMKVLQTFDNKELEGRGLFYLLYASDDEGEVQKAIKRRLRVFAKKYPSIIKGLLPTPR